MRSRLCLAPTFAHAPDRCTERARRLVKVKFVALPMPLEDAPPPSALALFLSRVFGFLAVARR